jgi:hypothetical protein
MVRDRGALDRPERPLFALFLMFSALLSCSRRTYPVAAHRSWKIRRFIL